MKQILIIVFVIIVSMFSKQMCAQQKKESCCILKKDLIGTWQRNSKIVGSGLNQNFEFSDDGTFIIHLGNNEDDARGIIELKGKYRLDKNKLFFTITSRTIVDGKIGIADMGISLCIFEIENGKVQEIQESNPEEIFEPCYITLFASTHIKINNEIYYKVKK